MKQVSSSQSGAAAPARKGSRRAKATAFHSILFAEDNVLADSREPPDFFGDLNLDQVFEAVAARRAAYDLKPFFYVTLRDVASITYRQEVMRDMEDAALSAQIQAFAGRMATVRDYLGLASQTDLDHHRRGWFLEAALAYCSAVAELNSGLAQQKLKSHGLLAFRDFLAGYANSEAFQRLAGEARQVKERLAGITYSVIIETGKFRVRRYEGEVEYSGEVEKIFAKFKQGKVKDYRIALGQRAGMNHIEAKILEFVALLHPLPFAALEAFCRDHSQFVNETLRRFDREIQFYAAYLEFIAAFRNEGLPFCYPQVGASREVYCREGFDLALANALREIEHPVVGNDFFLNEPERIIVISGPNQGGKTTFARMFGQLHYLACLGCPVPGREARLFLFDQIYAHFERQENIRNLSGKLEDDLKRIHEALTRITPDSILILNEIFASTTLQDAVFLSKEILARVLELDLLCVWVTFIDELSTAGEKTVSMVSTVAPENPALRTFKIIRKPADGLAYALSLAEKHGLTYEQILERLAP